MTSQAAFSRAVLAPDLAAPAGLSDGQGRAAGKRFDVYRNNVAVSLTEALVTGFPTVHGVVGDAFFRAMAGVFLRRHPPASALMMFYGAEMPDFLAGFAPAATLPYLPDVARIDLGLRRAYHAEDATPLAAEALRIEPEALMAARLALAPAVHILRSAYPIHGIWQMQHGGPKPAARPECVLISRPDFDPKLDLLSPEAAAFLEALVEGQTLSQALDTASLDPATGLAPLLGLALERGVFTELAI
ncbi:MAG: DNA-binding domain-containing protein [Pseudomonadota bacterium]